MEVAQHLNVYEIICRCGCRRGYMHVDLLRAWEAMRKAWGQPLRVTSGFRCAEHNRRIGGSPKSMHLVGKALDIRLRHKDDLRWVVRAAIVASTFTCVIRYPDPLQLHLDVRVRPDGGPPLFLRWTPEEGYMLDHEAMEFYR